MKNMEWNVFNINQYVKVKIKDKGIEYYVSKHNEIMPFKLHISFNEFKKRQDKEGYHTMQMHSFIDSFGCLGLRIAEYIDVNILFFNPDVLQ